MSELVVGTRRNPGPKPWRASIIAFAMVIAAAVVAWFIFRRAVRYDMPAVTVTGGLTNLPATQPNLEGAVGFGAATHTLRGGLHVLRVRGEPHEMGAAHGRLLAEHISTFLAESTPIIKQLGHSGGLLASVAPKMMLAWRLRFIDDGLTDSDRRWLAGMVQGAKAARIAVDYTAAVHAAAAIDIGAPDPRTAEADTHVVARSLSLLTPFAADPTRVWLASLHAVPGFHESGSTLVPVVTIAQPSTKLAWAGVGWAGHAGVLAGMNATGIAVSVHPVRSGDVTTTARAARPTPLLVRAVLENAHTLEEATTLLSKTEALGAAAFVLLDGNTGKSIVFERTPEKFALNRQAAAVIGDTLENPAFATDPQNDRARRQLPSALRVTRATRLLHTPPNDLSAFAGILRDHHTPDDVDRGLGHRGTIADALAASAVIFDARARMMWVADPQSQQRMRAFDLRAEFGLAAGTEPIGDLAPESDNDSELRERIALARSALRAARAAMVRRELADAQDHVARALALAPNLQECIELAAQIAAAKQDFATARAFAERWLSNAPDYPAGEERARAILAR